MLGFGTSINQVFRSRWKAVTWSLGILLTAYCSVPSPDQDTPPVKLAAVHEAAPNNADWNEE